MHESLPSIINRYENALFVREFDLTSDEFYYLYLSGEGYKRLELMNYLHCKKDKLYGLRDSIVNKMKTRNFKHALFIYAKITTTASINNKTSSSRVSGNY